MNRLRLVCFLLLILTFNQAQTNTGQTNTELAGGVPLVDNPQEAFALVGDISAVRLERVLVSGQDFGEAWRIIGVKELDLPYRVQLAAANERPVLRGDTLLLRFYARAAAPSKGAVTEVLFESKGPDYSRSVGTGLRLGSDWRRYQIPFRAHQDFAPGEGVTRFRVGYADQSFELGGLELLSFGDDSSPQDFALLGFGYAGRAEDAPWRLPAQERIERYRMAELRLRVVDADGQPVPDAEVEVTQTRHSFPFGSALDAATFLENATYRETFFELFNQATFENDLKWTPWEAQGPESVLAALGRLEAKNIGVRGHTLIWPCEATFCLPEDVERLLETGDTDALRARIDAHFVDVLEATQGRIAEWDVVNEASANVRLNDLLGEDERARWFERAQELEPTAKLFINDYDNLGEGKLDAEYKRVIRALLDAGAPLDGVGLQGHFAYQLTPPEELHERLTDFGQFGLPLAITEFDVDIPDEQLQANYLRDVLTVAFANPYVESFTLWGFWAGRHWRPQAALYRDDWTPKPAAEAYQELVFGDWWTEENGETNNSGIYQLRGFLGDYQISVTVDGEAVTRTFALRAGGGGLTVRLE